MAVIGDQAVDTYSKCLAGETVLVTGAGGFIGQHLVRALHAFDCQVHGLVRRHLSNTQDVYEHVIELADAEAVHQVINQTKPKVIFHLASPPDGAASIQKDGVFYEDIVLGTYHVLKAAHALGGRRVVLAGTAKEYGSTAILQDRTGRSCCETDTVMPSTPYALAKLTACLMGQMYYQAMALPVVSLRLFPTYGPGMDPNAFVVQAIRAALSGQALSMTLGEQRRDFVYCADVVKAFLHAACAQTAPGRIINICTGRAITIRDLAGKIYAIAGSEKMPRYGNEPYRREEVWYMCGNPSLAKELLAWQAETELDEGLRITVEHYRSLRKTDILSSSPSR